MKVTAKDVTNRDDIIDSRDVIARIALLKEDTDPPEQKEPEELDALLKLQEEFITIYREDTGMELWRQGVTLVNDDYFEEFAQNEAEEMLDIPSDICQWPWYCMDWDRAARELKMDFSSVEFDGQTYWTNNF